MAGKSYHQFCPIAYTLDLVGDRWTLLLLRELMFGPRQFTDLVRGLRGIGRNLLSQRLKDLEAEGVIRQRTLPPPTPAAVYELTETGGELRQILDDLTRWGLRFMPAASLEEDYLSVVATMNALNVMFDPSRAGDVHLDVEIWAGDELFHALVHEETLQLGMGRCEQPDLILVTHQKVLVSLAASAMEPVVVVDSGQLTLERGNPNQLAGFFDLFRFPQAQI